MGGPGVGAAVSPMSMCRDCGVRYAQEMGLCRTCSRRRSDVDTPETRRCAQCALTPPHRRCTYNKGHAGPHSYEQHRG